MIVPSVSSVRNASISILMILSAVMLASAAEATKTGKDLVSTDFTSTIASGMWFVEFFSPYCPHCKQFKPTWSTLVEMHEHLAESSDFHFARVDCISQGDICHSQGIKGYPSLQLYADGAKGDEFTEDRSFELLSTFILSHAAEYKKHKAASET